MHFFHARLMREFDKVWVWVWRQHVRDSVSSIVTDYSWPGLTASYALVADLGPSVVRPVVVISRSPGQVF